MITIADLLNKIRKEELDEITTDTNIINANIAVAEAIVAGIIPRYDFNTVDVAIKDAVCCVALYKIFMLIAPNKIPVSRLDEYEKAISYCKLVAKGQQSTSLTVKTDENGSDILNVIESGTDEVNANLTIW